MKCAICGEYASGWSLEMNSDGKFEFRCNKHKEADVSLDLKKEDE